MVLLAAEALRRIRVFGRREGTGRKIVFLLVISYVLIGAVNVAMKGAHCGSRWGTNRARVEARLKKIPGKDLVFVRYPALRSMRDIHLREWVVNDADLENADILWVHDMGAANRKLADYYPDRKTWLLLSEPNRPAVLRGYAFRKKGSASQAQDGRPVEYSLEAEEALPPDD